MDGSSAAHRQNLPKCIMPSEASWSGLNAEVQTVQANEPVGGGDQLGYQGHLHRLKTVPAIEEGI